jgi:hypothetical protein
MEKQLQDRVKRDGKSLLEWIRIHSLRSWPGLVGPELGFSRTPTASVLRNDACLRLPARNKSEAIPNSPRCSPALDLAMAVARSCSP